jgi:ubiquinone/menaquinone biosynthesis C-methylase UbiE
MRRERLKEKYGSEQASQYDKDRRNRDSWQNEQQAVECILKKPDVRSEVETILDAPVGTGRFFDAYESMSVDALGIDVSEDMLEQAKKS